MSGKLISVAQENIGELFAAKDSFFLIPDYQRPYAWTEDECLTLWEDICAFVSIDSEFNSDDDEYFLGPIVVFSNENQKLEVIDGQQRIISILLMLRAFYQDMQDFSLDWSREVRKNIGKCIWKTNEQGEPDFSKLKIDSQVATDDDRNEFIDILRTGVAPKSYQSRYALNYRLFQKQICSFMKNEDKLDQQVQKKYSLLPNRILNNCIILLIQAITQNSALRIFSTLNDRGKPLSDSDIFKVQLYKAFSSEGRKDYFTEQWRKLEAICEKVFTSVTDDNPVDELFNRYMHYEKAVANIKYKTQTGLRSFYEENNYSLLRVEHNRVLANLLALANFWNDVANQDEDMFSDRVLKRLFVLNYAPNAVWTLITSVYFMHNKKPDGKLDEEKFYAFLGRITAFIWAYTIMGAGVSNLKRPIYKEMFRIINGQNLVFDSCKFSADGLKSAVHTYDFSSKKKMVRSMLAWWAMQDHEQSLPVLTTVFETEHISKKCRSSAPITYEMLGNKSLLESKIKTAASSFSFEEKRKYYTGTASSRRGGTLIHELQELAKTKSSFNVKDINQRNRQILESFLEFVRDNQLTK